MNAIEISGLSKSYTVGFLKKTRKIGLQPLHLEVKQGEVFGFLGPNGAGKTTTLKLLMGLIFPTSGSAQILGRFWRDPGVRARIGFLPEQPYFYDHLTPAELLSYYGRLSGMSSASLRQRVPNLLEQVGLAAQGNVQLRKFSKGMMQRVGIAQAVLHDPEIVFLDEPMSGLDPVGRREVRDFIQELSAQGKTIFFSTHILSDAETLCDRVAVMNQGELKGVAVVSELVAQNLNRFEVVWQGTSAVRDVKQLGGRCHTAGDTVRATIEKAQLEKTLELLRQHSAQLVSVTPVGGSLEEFFLAKLAEPSEALR